MRPRLTLTLLVSASLLSSLFLVSCDEMGSNMNAGATKAGAPAGAKFLDPQVGARDVYFAVMAAPPADRDAVRQDLIGMWVHANGWEADVEAVAREKNGWSIRMYLAEPKVIGGGIWLIALVPGDEKPCERRDVAKVQGRIADIQSSAKTGQRVIIDGVTVLSSRKGN